MGDHIKQQDQQTDFIKLMALKDLKSNLKDLSFGQGTAYDRPNQGHSSEPFIKKRLNLGGDTGFNSITGGFIRGGLLLHAERNLQDVARIGKFLITGRGITFLAKQIGLQKSNPKVSEPAFERSKANHRTYNLGINTLAQVVGQGTGLHVNRQGLTPFAKGGYADEDKFLDKDTNRLLYLYDNHIKAPPPTNQSEKTSLNIEGKSEEKSGVGKFIQKVGEEIKNAFTNPKTELYTYGGGPGSTYGIGNTNIYKYSPSLNGFPGGAIEYTNTVGGPIPKTGFDVNTILYRKHLIIEGIDTSNDLDNLADRDKNFKNIGGDTYNIKLGTKQVSPDIRIGKKVIAYNELFKDHILNGKTRTKNYLATLGKIPEDNYNKKRKGDTKSYHREERVNLGNPGGNPLSLGNTTVDLLNAIDVFESGGDFNSHQIRDLIRFRIEAVDPTNPTKSNVMVFRAFLDGLNDNFTANYNEFTYNGRGENFYTYNGFNRDISFNFKIAAQSSKEMKPLYRKLNYLLSNTAPEYHETSGRMMTPFMRLTMGSYFERLPGVIKNVGITWQKDYPWEICLDGPEGGSTKGLFVLPHVLDVNVTYQPIHDFLPRKSIHSPFIIPHKTSAIAKTEGRKSWNSDPISKTTYKTETVEGEEVVVVDTEGLNIAIANRTKQTTN